MTSDEVIFMLQHNNVFEEAYMTGNFESLEEIKNKPSYVSLFGSRDTSDVYGEYIQYIEGENEVILKCNCKHHFQDSVYGEAQRVHNLATKKSTSDQKAYRCTVCSNVQMVSAKK